MKNVNSKNDFIWQIILCGSEERNERKNHTLCIDYETLSKDYRIIQMRVCQWVLGQMLLLKM